MQPTHGVRFVEPGPDLEPFRIAREGSGKAIVHVLMDGRIVLTGGKDLALELEAKGYDWVKDEPQAKAA